MAEVFLARQHGADGFERLVVLKRALPSEDNDHLEARLRREARLLSKLDHPGIAAIHEVGRDDAGLFVAMEYVRGHDLRTVMKAVASAGRKFEPGHVITIGAQVADALAYAHGRRDEGGRILPIIHRDVSPSNIIIRPDGRVKLLDFGVARDAAGPTITSSSSLVGKLPYMSPEQIELRELDGRTDMFSLGVVLWELLALRRPFPSDHVTLLRTIPTTDVPSIRSVRPDVPEALARIVARMLARDRDHRYADASSVQRELSRAAERLHPRPGAPMLAELMTQLFESSHDSVPSARELTEVAPTDTLGSSARLAVPQRRRGYVWMVAAAVAFGGLGIAWAATDGEPAPAAATVQPSVEPPPTVSQEKEPVELAPQPEPVVAAPVPVEAGADAPAEPPEASERPAMPEERRTRRRKARGRAAKDRKLGSELDPVLPPGFGAGAK